MHTQPRALEAAVSDGCLTENLGLDLNNLLHALLHRETPVPCSTQLHLSTGEDQQDTLEVVLMRGNRVMARDASLVGVYSITGFQPRPRGVPQIAITVAVDGTDLSVSAEENGVSLRVERLPIEA